MRLARWVGRGVCLQSAMNNCQVSLSRASLETAAAGIKQAEASDLAQAQARSSGANVEATPPSPAQGLGFDSCHSSLLLLYLGLIHPHLGPGLLQLALRRRQIGAGLRHSRPDIARINFHHQVTLLDPLVVVNQQADHLSGHPRANERDVAFNKRVIGVLVRSDKQQIVSDDARHQNDGAHASENLQPAPAFAWRRWTRFGGWGSNVGRLVGGLLGLCGTPFHLCKPVCDRPCLLITESDNLEPITKTPQSAGSTSPTVAGD